MYQYAVMLSRDRMCSEDGTESGSGQKQLIRIDQNQTEEYKNR